MKTLAESLFDDDLISKDIKLGDSYELECVYMQSRYCFKKLYTKKIISQYSKLAKEKDLKKYWTYYGHDDKYKSPPPEMEAVCNVFIGLIENFPMSKVHTEKGVDRKESAFVFTGGYNRGRNDSFSNALRRYLNDFVVQYEIGMHPHDVYVDTDYTYHQQEGCIHVMIGKNKYSGNHVPDRMEFIFKKK